VAPKARNDRNFRADCRSQKSISVVDGAVTGTTRA
jgi:hypothetical protein